MLSIQVVDDRIEISGDINLVFNIPIGFKYLGSQKISLERNHAEQYMFIVSEEKRIKKLFLVQSEYFDEEEEGAYTYKSEDIVILGGVEWVRDNFLFLTDPKYQSPNSDMNQMNNFFIENGFETIKYIKNNRLATFPNEEKREELLVIYAEVIEEEYFWSFVKDNEVIEEKWNPVKEQFKIEALEYYQVLQ